MVDIYNIDMIYIWLALKNSYLKTPSTTWLLFTGASCHAPRQERGGEGVKDVILKTSVVVWKTYLEPETSIKNMFFFSIGWWTKSLHGKWLLHQRSTKNWLFGVPVSDS